MPLSANDSRPTSVRGSRSGYGDPAGRRRSRRRSARLRSAAAGCGAPPRSPATPSTTSTAAPIPTCDQTSARTVDWTSDRSMATVVSSPWGPCTDTARHWTCELSIEPTVTGSGPTSLSCGQGRFGVAVVDGHPDVAVGVDSPNVEVRRRTGGVGFHRRRRHPARGLRPAAGGVEQRLVDAVDQAVPQDRGDGDPGGQQAARHQHQGGGHQPDPQRHPSSAQTGHSPIVRARMAERRITAAPAAHNRHRAGCAEGASRRCRSCGAGRRRRTRRH